MAGEAREDRRRAQGGTPAAPRVGLAARATGGCTEVDRRARLAELQSSAESRAAAPPASRRDLGLPTGRKRARRRSQGQVRAAATRVQRLRCDRSQRVVPELLNGGAAAAARGSGWLASCCIAKCEYAPSLCAAFDAKKGRVTDLVVGHDAAKARRGRQAEELLRRESALGASGTASVCRVGFVAPYTGASCANTDGAAFEIIERGDTRSGSDKYTPAASKSAPITAKQVVPEPPKRDHLCLGGVPYLLFRGTCSTGRQQFLVSVGPLVCSHSHLSIPAAASTGPRQRLDGSCRRA